MTAPGALLCVYLTAEKVSSMLSCDLHKTEGNVHHFVGGIYICSLLQPCIYATTVTCVLQNVWGCTDGHPLKVYRKGQVCDSHKCGKPTNQSVQYAAYIRNVYLTTTDYTKYLPGITPLAQRQQIPQQKAKLRPITSSMTQYCLIWRNCLTEHANPCSAMRY